MAVVPQETHLAFDYTRARGRADGTLSAPRRVRRSRVRATSRSRGRRSRRPGRCGWRRAVLDAQRRREAARHHRGGAGADLARRAGRHRPGSILLLDEPTAALDLKYQLEIASLLALAAVATRLTVVVSTHDLNFAAALCQTLVMLKNGRVLASGPTDEVLTPGRMRELYDVDADVVRIRAPAGLVIVPDAPRRAGPRP